MVIPPLKYHIMSVFERKVMVGGNIWNDSAHEVPLALDKTNARTVPSADRARMVGADPCGITFASAGFAGAKTRLVPIAAEKGQPYVTPTLETVRDGSYPLALEVYAYADQLPDQPLDPKLKEFLRFVLSREGQEIVQRDGKWLPLTASMVAGERKKLDAIIPQVVAPTIAAKKAKPDGEATEN